MSNDSIEGASFYDGEDGFHVESSPAFDVGCIAGSRWMQEGGTSKKPTCPYSGTQAREWMNGFNMGANETVFP